MHTNKTPWVLYYTLYPEIYKTVPYFLAACVKSDSYGEDTPIFHETKLQ